MTARTAFGSPGADLRADLRAALKAALRADLRAALRAAILAAPLLCPALPAVADGGATSKELRLGMSAPFKGPDAGIGIEGWRGAQACFDAVNAKGGVGGRKIRLVCSDDGGDPEEILANTMRLLDMDGSFALFAYGGMPGLGMALPVIQSYARQGVFLFSTFDGGQAEREGPRMRRVFTVRASYREEASALVKLLADTLGVPKIGVLAVDDAYGRSGLDGVRRALSERGLKPVSALTYPADLADGASMEEQVASLRAADAQAVILAGGPGPGFGFIRDARKAGYKAVIAGLSTGDADAVLARLLKEGKTKAWKGREKELTARLVESEVVPSWSDLKVPLVAEYRKAADSATTRLSDDIVDGSHEKEAYSFTALEGYLDAKLFAAILAKAPQELTREGFLKAAEESGPLDVGLDERASFSAQKHQALDEVFLCTVKDGAWAPLTDAGVLKP